MDFIICSPDVPAHARDANYMRWNLESKHRTQAGRGHLTLSDTDRI